MDSKPNFDCSPLIVKIFFTKFLSKSSNFVTDVLSEKFALGAATGKFKPFKIFRAISFFGILQPT